MMRPWLFVPWLALAAVVASVGAWQVRKDHWQPPSPHAPELPELAALPSVEPVSMTQALAHPVLWAARQPVEQGGGKAEPEPELAQARLLAVVSAGKEQIALLTAKDGSSLKLTSQTSPWKLERFDGRTAVFVSTAGKRVQRPLERQAAPPPTLPSAQPPARPPAAAPAAGPARQH